MMPPSAPPSSTPDVAAPALWLPCRSLWRREIVHFIRQRSRIGSALGMPLVFWVIAGAGLGRSFHTPGAESSVSYLTYSFPGALAAILLFTAVFSTISLIEDRRAGFMQAVLVAPVSRAAIVLGKVLGAVTLAVAQAVLFLLLAPIAGITLGPASVAATFAAMSLLAVAVSNLGFWLAWRMESTQGFHAVMNLVLMPMLVLSGAFFPPAGAAAGMKWVLYLNPMTYGVSLLRAALEADAPRAISHGGPGVAASLSVTLAFAVVTFLAAMRAVHRDAARAVA